MPDKYDHLLPPERPRGYKPPRPTDLDCYGNTTAGVSEAIGEVWKGVLVTTSVFTWLYKKVTGG
jgi:hypothetical protein